MTNLTASLWIALIGMGLVFIVILLLWGLMELLVKLTADKKEAEPRPEAEALPESTPAETALAPSAIRRQAAVAAVAAALALKKKAAAVMVSQTGQAANAWQAAMRAASINLRNSQFTRTIRGSKR